MKAFKRVLFMTVFLTGYLFSLPSGGGSPLFGMYQMLKELVSFEIESAQMNIELYRDFINNNLVFINSRCKDIGIDEECIIDNNNDLQITEEMRRMIEENGGDIISPVELMLPVDRIVYKKLSDPVYDYYIRVLTKMDITDENSEDLYITFKWNPTTVDKYIEFEYSDGSKENFSMGVINGRDIFVANGSFIENGTTYGYTSTILQFDKSINGVDINVTFTENAINPFTIIAKADDVNGGFIEVDGLKECFDKDGNPKICNQTSTGFIGVSISAPNTNNSSNNTDVENPVDSDTIVIDNNQISSDMTGGITIPPINSDTSVVP